MYRYSLYAFLRFTRASPHTTQAREATGLLEAAQAAGGGCKEKPPEHRSGGGGSAHGMRPPASPLSDLEEGEIKCARACVYELRHICGCAYVASVGVLCLRLWLCRVCDCGCVASMLAGLFRPWFMMCFRGRVFILYILCQCKSAVDVSTRGLKRSVQLEVAGLVAPARYLAMCMLFPALMYSSSYYFC